MADHGSKPVHVLGTGLSHDGSACLLRDGRVLVAIEKERLTRVKHDGHNDTAAIQYCLDAAGIRAADLDLVVQNANFSMLPQGNDWFRGPRPLDPAVPVVTISHHLAHAYSAAGASPWGESAVLVLDGCGNSFDDCMDLDGAELPERPCGDLAPLYFEKDSYYRFENGRVASIYKDFSPWGEGLKESPMCPTTTRHSIGGVYLAASMYVFSGFEDPGKLMGLAPFGRAGAFEDPVFELRDGRAFVRYDWMSHFRRPCRDYAQFKRDFQYYADIACWIQREVERAILYIVAARHAKAPADALCYSGGVALNAVANGRLVREGPYRRVWIQPAAADNGLAIGCAYYGWLQVLGREKVMPSASTCFGITYPDASIERALSRAADVEVRRVPDSARAAATWLASGRTVGWFQGGAEFGPRALGNRSILADARQADVKTRINARIKNREDFRPFAPAVLIEDLTDYFECDVESPYMLLVAPVKPYVRRCIPSVVHEDGSARIQTVSEASNPTFHRLLKAFKALSGIGVLLNTSFNRRGQPIVETPQQALDLFLETELDVLVVHDFVVTKRGRPATAPAAAS